MKKILLVFLLVLLVGCEDYTQSIDCKDNNQISGLCIDLTKPTFQGVEDITIKKGDHFGPMIDVFATDDLDGDITNKITYTGQVNKNEIGTYLLTYRVEDLAGNETIHLRYVTVEVDASEVVGVNLVWNGNFELGFTGWGTYQGENGTADLNIVNDELEIIVEKVTSGIPWEPRIEFQGLNFIEGETYFVEFTIRSDKEMLFQVQIGELLTQEPWFIDYNGSMNKQFLSKNYDITHTFTFTVSKDTTENGCILFEFGGLSAGHELTTFYLDNVSIKLLD